MRQHGLGYILRTPLTLPPMILTPEELEALTEGLRGVAAGGGPNARGARALLFKVATLLPQAGIVPADDRSVAGGGASGGDI